MAVSAVRSRVLGGLVWSSVEMATSNISEPKRWREKDLGEATERAEGGAGGQGGGGGVGV